MKLVFLLSLSLALPALAKGKKRSVDDVHTVNKTRFDFNEANIDGEMKAPSGFYLKGRGNQRLSQMVKLRSNFKKKLNNTKWRVRQKIK